MNFTPSFRIAVTPSNSNSTLTDYPTAIVDDDVDVSNVRFAYVALGSMILTAGVLFIVAYIRGRYRLRSSATSDDSRESAVDVKETALDEHDEESVTDPLKGPTTSAGNSEEQRATIVGSSFLRDRYFIAILHS